jgi:hypothetical protein
MKKLEPRDYEMTLVEINKSEVVTTIFKQSYLNKGKISVKKDGWRYYCKEDEPYYVNDRYGYALVQDPAKIEEATTTLIKEKIQYVKENTLAAHKHWVDKTNKIIEDLEKLL